MTTRINNTVVGFTAINVAANGDFTRSDEMPSGGIRCNVTGNVTVLLWNARKNDALAVTVLLTAGIDYPYQVMKVFQTGTTATGVVLLER